MKDVLRKGKSGMKKKAQVQSARLKSMRRRRCSKLQGEVSGDASDDSIGSASDLRAREEEEDEREKKGMGETETINDSVLTCGSSAYHAETESMALEENIIKCPRVPEVPETEGDMLFVGHSYGEKPLLLDDELDTDDDNLLPKENRDEKLSKDVFALAPFQRPDVKRKVKRDLVITPDSVFQLSTPSPPLLVAISPVVAEGSLVDLSDNNNECHDIKDSGDYDYIKSFYISPEVSCNLQPLITCEHTVTDLFGSSPFVKKSNNPFTETRGITSTTTNGGLYHKTSIVIGGNTCEYDPPQVSNVFISSSTSSAGQDLFGSIPFESVPQRDGSQFFQSRPTSLSVNTHSFSLDVANYLPQRLGELALEPTDDSSSPEALVLPIPHEGNNNKLKRDNHQKLQSLSEKCKYHLIEDRHRSPLQQKHKIIKSSASKKGIKISKKIGKMSKTGFSNMSFEDFPSDEAEDTPDHSSSVPFEVLRDEKTPVDSDLKFGSLRNRTNPFS